MVRVYYGDHFEHPSTHEHLTTPETVAKFLNLFLSFLLIIGGIGCAAVGIWIASSANEYNYFIESNGLTPTILLIAYGVAIFFFSSVACCATARHSGFLLGVIVVSMFLLICGEVIGITYAYSYEETFKNETTDRATELIKSYSRRDFQENSTDVFDKIQRDLECCGVSDGPSDWTRKSDGSYIAVWWIERGNHENDVPDSCCVKNVTGCGLGTANSTNGTLWQKGCVPALFDWFGDQMVIFVAIVVIVLVLQIINVCGMYLWRRCIVHGF